MSLHVHVANARDHINSNVYQSARALTLLPVMVNLMVLWCGYSFMESRHSVQTEQIRYVDRALHFFDS